MGLTVEENPTHPDVKVVQSNIVLLLIICVANISGLKRDVIHFIKKFYYLNKEKCNDA